MLMYVIVKPAIQAVIKHLTIDQLIVHIVYYQYYGIIVEVTCR